MFLLLRLLNAGIYTGYRACSSCKYSCTAYVAIGLQVVDDISCFAYSVSHFILLEGFRPPNPLLRSELGKLTVLEVTIYCINYYLVNY